MAQARQVFDQVRKAIVLVPVAFVNYLQAPLTHDFIRQLTQG